MEYLIVILATFIAGVVQTVSGFGGSLTIMMLLPTIMPLMDAITLNQTIMIILIFSLVVIYRKAICMKKVWLPTLACIVFTTFFTDLAIRVDVRTMKLLFGIFLVCISIYFWFFAKKVRSSSSPVMGLVCGSISGITNGLFGVGGPPIAVYYLAVSDSKDSYIGNTQMVFLISTLYTIAFRFSKGLVCESFWQYAIVGILTILFGMWIGKKINDRISPETMKKCVYVCLFVSGLNTIYQCL